MAVVNYLWSAALLAPLEPVEQLVEELTATHLERGLNAEAYGEYLQAVARGADLRPDRPLGRSRRGGHRRVAGRHEPAGLALGRLWARAQAGRSRARRSVPAGVPRDRVRERGATANPPDGERRDATRAARRRPRRGERRSGISSSGCRCTRSRARRPRSRSRARSPRRATPYRLEALLRMLSGTTERVGAPGVLEAVTRGLARLARRASRTRLRGSSLAAEDDLRALGRHYDAACVALDLALCLDAARRRARRGGCARACLRAARAARLRESVLAPRGP